MEVFLVIFQAKFILYNWFTEYEHKNKLIYSSCGEKNPASNIKERKNLIELLVHLAN